MLLLALFMPWQTKAQETLTVCEGTAANEYIPMYGYYFDNFTKSECIIPATELTDMVGSSITAITFYAKSVASPNSTWGNARQKVFLKELSSNSLGNNYAGMADATIVFDGLLPMPTTSADGYTINFTEQYIYNGGHLLIGIYNEVKGKYNKVEWYGINTQTSGASAYGYNGGNISSCSFNSKPFLPKTTFTFTTGACAKPKDLVVSDIMANSALLSWPKGSNDQTNWEVYLTTTDMSDPGDNPTPIMEATECTKQLENLQTHTTYYVFVRSVCGGWDGVETLVGQGYV